MTVDLLDEVTGYLDEGQVVVTCEVHGFLRSTNPPWLLDSSGRLVSSADPKYTITQIDSSQPAVLISNGSSVPGWRTSLTINQLMMSDSGNYTCAVDGNSTSTTLTVVAGIRSAPPSVSTTCQVLFTGS